MNVNDIRNIVNKCVNELANSINDDLVEYCRLRPADTGLKVDIFIDDGGAYLRNNHPLYVYVQNDYNNVMNVLPIDVESSNQLILNTPGNIGISLTDYQNVLKYINQNKNLIKQLADGEINHMDYINNHKNELTNYNDWIDISTLDEEALDSAKFDLRLVPHAVSFDDIICNVIEDKQYLMESAGDSLPPDEVIENIVNKYQLDRRLIKKVERANKIYVYVITALIGENVDMIKNDMEIMGYFFGRSGREYLIDGQKYIQLQFEPYCQLQQDVTDEIKNKYNVLYHWTPEYHLDDIITQGLLPLHENKVFNYPPRIYLIKGDVSFKEIKMLGDGLSRVNDNENNNGCYVLLGIELSELDYDIKFYYDPNYRNGVFTEQRIPPEYIKVITRERFKTSLKPPLK